MTDFNTVENSEFPGSEGNSSDFELELNTLTYEQVEKQIKSHLALISKQLEDLTKLFHGIARTYQVSLTSTERSRIRTSTAGTSRDQYCSKSHEKLTGM